MSSCGQSGRAKNRGKDPKEMSKRRNVRPSERKISAFRIALQAWEKSKKL